MNCVPNKPHLYFGVVTPWIAVLIDLCPWLLKRIAKKQKDPFVFKTSLYIIIIFVCYILIVGVAVVVVDKLRAATTIYSSATSRAIN